MAEPKSTLLRIAEALESLAHNQELLTKTQLSQRQDRKPFKTLLEESLGRTITLSERLEKGGKDLARYGNHLPALVQNIITNTMHLFPDLEDEERSQRLMIDDDAKAQGEKTTALIQSTLGPDFMAIRSQFEGNAKIFREVYDMARENAIEVIKTEGFYGECMGTTYRIRSLLDNDANALKASGAYEKLIVIRAGLRFLETILEETAAPLTAVA